ncbi:hypothetical protein [Haloarchaeobius litoreus]|uniref:Metallo-peptidase family M12B Reprolysin-like n=1 Tax=Haloarchaeobius litoreus TaxID=755306 RepID=A0ABD6DF03_9EURY|nr:hypothetical protein [Haloarchaeobius litoreus]
MPDRRDVLKASGATAFTSIVPFTSSANESLPNADVEQVNADFLSVRFGIDEKPEGEPTMIGTRSNIPHIEGDDGIYLPLHHQSSEELATSEVVVSSPMGITYDNQQSIELDHVPLYSSASGRQRYLSRWSSTSPIEYEIRGDRAIVWTGGLRVDVEAGEQRSTIGRIDALPNGTATVDDPQQFNARLSVSFHDERTLVGHRRKELIPAASHQGRLAQRAARQSSVTLSSGSEAVADSVEGINGFTIEKIEGTNHTDSVNIHEVDSLSDVSEVASNGTTVVAFKTREFPSGEGWGTVQSLTGTAESIWNSEIKQDPEHGLNITYPTGLDWVDLPHVPDEINRMSPAVDHLATEDSVQEALSVADATCIIDDRPYTGDSYNGMANDTGCAGDAGEPAVCLVGPNRDNGLLTAHEIGHLYNGAHDFNGPDGSSFKNYIYDYSIMGDPGTKSCHGNDENLWREGHFSGCTASRVRYYVENEL